MVAGDDIGCGEITHHGQRYAARAGIARKHNLQAAPVCDAANSPPFSGQSRWVRAGFVAGQPHKIANLEDWDGSSIGAEIKLHGCNYAQSLGD